VVCDYVAKNTRKPKEGREEDIDHLQTGRGEAGTY
jgi:hypothetical protein